MVNTVIFDMDGLMFNTERMTRGLWDEIGSEMGYTHVSAIMPETMGVRLEDSEKIFARRFGPEFPYREFTAEYRKRFDRKIETEGVPVKDGLLELLEYLKQENYVCAVASSTSRSKVLHYFEKAGVTDFFRKIICGDMVEKTKPDPQIYLTAAHEIGEAPENCMVLEDSPNGCTAAYRAGMKTVMVPDLVQPDAELRKILFACIPSLRAAIPLLQKLREQEASAR